MPTILELFKGSPQDLAVSTTGNSSKSDFVKSVKTFVDQETSGIRIKSLVEANNPLIYGTGTIRITNRSIQTTEIQKSATGGDGATGGLVGKGLSAITGGKVNSLSEARDAVTSKLGLPQNLIPSTVVTNTDYFGDKGGEQDTMINLAQIRKDGAGTGVGQFLKQTGGGNPQTVGKQAVGQGIGLVKDELRKQAFGAPQTIGQLTGEKLSTTYDGINTYSSFVKNGVRTIYSEGGNVGQNPPSVVGIPGVPSQVLENSVKLANQGRDKIDLKLVSPVYGIDRKSTDGRFGTGEYAYVYSPSSPRRNEKLPEYDPTATYTEGKKWLSSRTLEERGYGSGGDTKGDAVNLLAPSDDYSRNEAEGLDFVPFWVSGLDSSKPVYFRASLTSVNETVTPTWNSSKFIGNPYNFYTYDGVERSLTFSLMIYCMNPIELAKNWEKIEYLTSKAYPSIPKGQNYVDAPFIKFRLGNMYVDKVAFIESLTYTVDQNSGWETDIDGFYLPKIMQVDATFKFVEWEGIERTLYNYKRNAESVAQLKEDREEFIQRREGLGAVIGRAEVPKYNTLGVEAELPPSDKNTKGGKSGPSKAPKDVNTGKSVKTPKDTNGIQENNTIIKTAIIPDEPPKYIINSRQEGRNLIVSVLANGNNVYTTVQPYSPQLKEKLLENLEKQARKTGFVITNGVQNFGFAPPSEDVTVR